ncbi:MAG: hypothetical protein ACK5T0_07820 [Vampirovibrionales bacterium]|jgi:hypothetical protein
MSGLNSIPIQYGKPAPISSPKVQKSPSTVTNPQSLIKPKASNLTPNSRALHQNASSTGDALWRIGLYGWGFVDGGL